MALPQYVVRDPDGNELGIYERRADAETAIQNHVQRHVSKYTVDDSAYRQAEALEQAEERVRAQQGALDAEKKAAAAEKKAADEAAAAHERDRQLLAESEAA